MDGRVSAQCFGSVGIFKNKVIVLGTIRHAHFDQGGVQRYFFSYFLEVQQQSIIISLDKKTKKLTYPHPSSNHNNISTISFGPSPPIKTKMLLHSLTLPPHPPPRLLPLLPRCRIRRHKLPLRVAERVRIAEDTGPRAQERHVVLELAQRAPPGARHAPAVQAVLRRVRPEAEGDAFVDLAITVMPTQRVVVNILDAHGGGWWLVVGWKRGRGVIAGGRRGL